MSKFTPGPWKLWEADSEYWWICEPSKETRHSHFAKISVGNFWGEEGEADARLISAAPDMYEALKAMFQANNDNDVDAMAKAMELGIEALAKADGK